LEELLCQCASLPGHSSLTVPSAQNIHLQGISDGSKFNRMNLDSTETRDRQKAGQLGATGYLVKPPTPQMLLEVLKSLNPVVPGKPA